MAEKIGWYVHYKAFNYRELGTMPPVSMGGKGSNYNKRNQVFGHQIRHIMGKFSGEKKDNNKLKQLETLLQDLLYPNNASKNIDQEILKALRTKVKKIFEDKYTQFEVNFNNGLQVYAKDKRFSLAYNTTEIGIKKLENYVNAIEEILKHPKTTDKNKDTLLQIQSNIIKEIQNVKNQNKDVLKLNESNKNIIEDINIAMKLSHLPYNEAIGSAFEIFLQVVAEWTRERTIEEIYGILIGENENGLLPQFSKGLKHKSYDSKKIINLDNFDKDIVTLNPKGITELVGLAGRIDSKSSDLSGNIQIAGTDDYFLQYKKSTKDKLDVDMMIGDQMFKISAKNYKLAEDGSQYIHLLSGSPLLTLIASDQPAFVNHWLNIAYSNENIKNDEGPTAIDKNDLTKAHNIMKFSIFAKALTGLGTSAFGQNSDVIIINARSEKKVYVKDTHSIITALGKQVGSSTDTRFQWSFSNYPNNRTDLKNEYVKTSANDDSPNQFLAKVRIANLLADMHSKKISVSIKKDKLV